MTYLNNQYNKMTSGITLKKIHRIKNYNRNNNNNLIQFQQLIILMIYQDSPIAVIKVNHG